MPVKIAIVDDKASNRNILKDKLLHLIHREEDVMKESEKHWIDLDFLDMN